MPQTIHTSEAPTPIAHYSQAMTHQGIVYLAGQIGLNPNSGTLCKESLEAETHQALSNCDAVLRAANSSRDQVIHVTIYLTNMDDFHTVNSVYAEFFRDHRPARAAIAVAALPKKARVEFSVTAAAKDLPK